MTDERRFWVMSALCQCGCYAAFVEGLAIEVGTPNDARPYESCYGWCYPHRKVPQARTTEKLCGLGAEHNTRSHGECRLADQGRRHVSEMARCFDGRLNTLWPFDIR
ncbi:hypothetical protein BDP81DRAFT_210918 [Colletotrichum phormii]|uniref:Uncharacterized protein n=1 Tax=Colletotrichum phormii TaxID=359342 RepID=A0AAI9ZSV2_9PEZI|nr:uncharacterized protein BDP81DRAFT_210918 [Colletotrichum phormii]KAK1637546.1 hypothetical protein BDP81DRAFT_210918 [Colletotrichum phormii]